MNTVSSASKIVFAFFKIAIKLIFIICILMSCSTGIENNNTELPTKFTVPGGTPLLRAVDASSIQAEFTLTVDEVVRQPLQMTRIGISDQWETPSLSIPPETSFSVDLLWSAIGVDGARVEYARQRYSSAGINSNADLNLSGQNYSFDEFNDDGGDSNNFEELLAGTPPTGPPEPTGTGELSDDGGINSVSMKFVSTEPEPTLTDNSSVHIELKIWLEYPAGSGSGPAAYNVPMTRIGSTNQWEAAPVNIPSGSPFGMDLVWSAIGVDGVRVNYSFQNYSSPQEGIVTDTFIDMSDTPHFTSIDADDDGVDNYQELLSGTQPVGPTGSVTHGQTIQNLNFTQVNLRLDSTSTVPPANVEGATGEGFVVVYPDTGAIGGFFIVSDTSGVPTGAHIHKGGPGEAGGIVVALVGTEEGSAWSIPAFHELSTSDVEAFIAGELYVNVHTDANPQGELRAQLTESNTPSASNSGSSQTP